MSNPHDIKWNDSEDEPSCIFESDAPYWLDVHKPNTVARWFLFYMERALSICYLKNVQGKFKDCTDENEKSVFVNSKIEKENANKMA